MMKHAPRAIRDWLESQHPLATENDLLREYNKPADPMITWGGCFKSGASLQRLTEVCEAKGIEADHPIWAWLPTPRPTRANTLKQVHRTMSVLRGTHGAHSVTVTTDSDDTDESVLIVHAGQDDEGVGLSLSETRYRVSITWDAQLIDCVSVTQLSGTIKAPQAVHDAVLEAQGHINSSEWHVSHSHLMRDTRCRYAWTGAYTSTRKFSEDLITLWCEIALECGQRVGRADQPHGLLAQDIRAELMRLKQDLEERVKSNTVHSRRAESQLAEIRAIALELAPLRSAVKETASELEALAEGLILQFEALAHQPKAEAKATPKATPKAKPKATSKAKPKAKAKAKPKATAEVKAEVKTAEAEVKLTPAGVEMRARLGALPEGRYMALTAKSHTQVCENLEALRTFVEGEGEKADCARLLLSLELPRFEATFRANEQTPAQALLAQGDIQVISANTLKEALSDSAHPLSFYRFITSTQEKK